MFIERKVSSLILDYIRFFPVVCITGPRQSGKTILIRKLFPNLPYFTLEDPDTRLAFNNDPRGFLGNLENGAIFDEVQQLPDIFSYLQGVVDSQNNKGNFILSGSQNFLLLNKVTQTLAGRSGIVNVFPFTLSELKNYFSLNRDEYMLKGFYPGIYDREIPPNYFFPNYIQTYIERDISNIKAITDKTAFYRFIKLCAARCGQILNYSQLATDCGISVNTAKAWLSLLESSYIIFLLPPYFTNISKQLVKSPKLYFYDIGLATYLLDIKNEEQLSTHYLYGSLFENLVVADILKQGSFKKGDFSFYFLRDKTGHEIDLMMVSDKIICFEIKASRTFNKDYIKNLLYFNSKLKLDELFLVYSGELKSKNQGVNLINWENISTLL
jgi:uncharacterized protein